MLCYKYVFIVRSHTHPVLIVVLLSIDSIVSLGIVRIIETAGITYNELVVTIGVATSD